MWLILLLIFIAILYIGYTIILLLYRKWFLQLKPFVAIDTIKPTTSFSIIIPARNEATVIKNCLLSILQQNYPTTLFEIIVIDDHSTDNTSAVVEEIQQQYNNVQLIKLQDTLEGKVLNSYKKKAIENAIDYAKGDWIITTDADCITPQKWLITYDAWIQQNNTVFIAAPVAFTNNGTLLQTFQYIDFMNMQGITAASVNAGFHNMCNGANLAYRKDIFKSVNGFKDIDSIASGDDMLLMNKIKKQIRDELLANPIGPRCYMLLENLLEECDDQGVVRISQTELAENNFITRQTLSKHMQLLQGLGCLFCTYGEITLIKKAILEKEFKND